MTTVQIVAIVRMQSVHYIVIILNNTGEIRVVNVVNYEPMKDSHKWKRASFFCAKIIVQSIARLYGPEFLGLLKILKSLGYISKLITLNS